MSVYLILKALHIISSTVLFGTGLGTAFFKWVVDRSGNVTAIRIVSEKVVLADWLFTTPAIVIQPITGIALANIAGFSLFKGWLACALGLYILAGACWLPVVWLQLQMRTLSREADQLNQPLPDKYWRYARIWFCLGIPAFLAIVVVFFLMVFKPF